MGVPGNTKEPGINPFIGEFSVSNTAVEIFTGYGNLYGFLVQNNSGADVFLQIFDKATGDAVVVGTTVPNFTYKIAADGIFGKDKNDSPLLAMNRGLKVAVTSTRTGGGAPTSAATCQFWYRNA